MIELEKTYLLKYFPPEIEMCASKEIIDVYFPAEREHPTLRLRKNGEKFELTKKSPLNAGDSSEQKEETIILDAEEFNALSQLSGKKSHKTRYYYDYRGQKAEIDVFKDELEGLVLVDFEFNSSEEKDNFKMPDFCLAEVTQENFAAGGMLCGKSYADIEEDLKKFSYLRVAQK